MTGAPRDKPIPLVSRGAEAADAPGERFDAPYRRFLLASLALAIFGGFTLAVLLPVAQARAWPWGTRWPALVQAHGQLQLIGFAGLFVMGMALRLMPRFSGRDLSHPLLVRALIPLVGGAVVLRALTQPFAAGALRDVGLAASAALLTAGALAFAAVIWRTLAHPASRAEATGWFFLLGALAFVAQAALNAVIVASMVRHGRELAPSSEQDALIFLQLFGFVLLFLFGVSTRAVPTLSGHARPDAPSRWTAIAAAAATAVYVAAALYAAYRSPSTAAARVEDAALLVMAVVFVAVAWLAGAVRPRANRVAPASQMQFQFVRAAFAWLIVAAALLGWYALRALRDGRVLDNFGVDAVRHTITVGVVTMMIVGMAMLVVPEFAGRRLQHPARIAPWLMLVALNAAVVLRIWPPLEGIDWIKATRFWPMAAAGGFAIAVILYFAFMFVQSLLEQRREGWVMAAMRAREASHPRGGQRRS